VMIARESCVGVLMRAAFARAATALDPSSAGPMPANRRRPSRSAERGFLLRASVHRLRSSPSRRSANHDLMR
jgi:hypothetical protein